MKMFTVRGLLDPLNVFFSFFLTDNFNRSKMQLHCGKGGGGFFSCRDVVLVREVFLNGKKNKWSFKELELKCFRPKGGSQAGCRCPPSPKLSGALLLLEGSGKHFFFLLKHKYMEKLLG